MLGNRSMPASTVIPVLSYPDVGKASLWLCQAFGFELRLRIANHRAQLGFGEGAVVVTELKADKSMVREDAEQDRPRRFAVMVRVEDVDAHHRRAVLHGAVILSEPTSYPYGERQYSCRDPGGHGWTFSQSIVDIAPEDWGGIVGKA
ncbi:VOC family protein [Mesorhizobium helmanticense]|uniref:Glyoxalase n=1 Tax=Mesorhizobium helmanticense TaxID=1776423 RepID=A0A2T4ISC0_9HYPH|nr:glyoxalase [Mesorhizobium helmanticense]